MDSNNLTATELDRATAQIERVLIAARELADIASTMQSFTDYNLADTEARALTELLRACGHDEAADRLVRSNMHTYTG